LMLLTEGAEIIGGFFLVVGLLVRRHSSLKVFSD
jgi:hypothetical protein